MAGREIITIVDVLVAAVTVVAVVIIVAADADADHADADADQAGRASEGEMRPILADEGNGDLRGDVRHTHRHPGNDNIDHSC